MEGSQDGERRARRTGIIIGFLAALVIALGVGLALALSGGDGSGQDETSATTPTATTAPTTASTQTTVTTTEPTTPTTTATNPPGSTINQVQAKDAARRGASAEVVHYGITIPPSDWDARCTAAGGFDQAPVWTCQVVANGGQCSGTLYAIARGSGVPGARDPHIACGE